MVSAFEVFWQALKSYADVSIYFIATRESAMRDVNLLRYETWKGGWWNWGCLSIFISLLFFLSGCNAGQELASTKPEALGGELIVYDVAQSSYFLQDITTGTKTLIPGVDNEQILTVGSTPDNNWLFIRLQDSETLYLVSLDGNLKIDFKEDPRTLFLQWKNNMIIEWQDSLTPINVINPFAGESQVLPSEFPYMLSEPLPPLEFSNWNTFLIFSPTLEHVIYVGDIFEMPSNSGLLWLADGITGEIIANIEAKLIVENPPVWSPDSQYFVAVDNKKYIESRPIFDLYLFNKKGEQVIQLTHHSQEHLIENISWSPNNHFVAFLKDYSTLSTINVQNGGLISETPIGFSADYRERFVWLSSGWHLVYQKVDDGESKLILFDVCKNLQSDIENSNNLIPIGWVDSENQSITKPLFIEDCLGTP
jgi:hypothetical protein